MLNRIVAIVMVKNEADIIESFVRHALCSADELLVTDHHSTDDTLYILEQLQSEGLSLKIDTYEGEGLEHSYVMTRLMYRAFEEEQADLVVAYDADEFLVHDEGNSTDLRRLLQQMDTRHVWRVPWIDYELLDPEKDQDKFLLSRHCRRNTAPNDLCKVIVGRLAAMEQRLHLVQGNHHVITKNSEEKGNFSTDVYEPMAEGIHLVHFPFRSQGQRLSKGICGWLSYVSKGTREGFYGTGLTGIFKDFLNGKQPDSSLSSLKDASGDDLGAYKDECVLRYTKGKVDAVANALHLAESIADSYCREKVMAKRRLVSVIVLFDGKMEAFQASMESIFSQKYPYCEVIVAAIKEEHLDALGKYMEMFQNPAKLLVGDIWAQLPGAVHGEYVQWVRNGDVLFPKKLMREVVLLETHLQASLIFSESTHCSRNFSPWTVSLSGIQGVRFFLGQEIMLYLLGNGVTVPGGISSVLFRKHVVESADYFSADFIGTMPLMLTIFKKTMQDHLIPALNEVFVEEYPERDADEYILNAMEWFYQLQQKDVVDMLSSEQLSEARKIFYDRRALLCEKLKFAASDELYQAYMTASF